MQVIILSLSTIFFVTNCTKQDDPPKEPTIPILTTKEVIEITQYTATCGGVFVPHFGATITEQGVCWDTIQVPTITDNKITDEGFGDFNSCIIGLTPNTTYFVRAYATSSLGTGYGNVISFTTLEEKKVTFGAMSDIDGITYKTVTIGSQTWMAENLKVTKYNDGTNIPNITNPVDWITSTTGAICDYDNILSNSETYGKLYNWNAVNTGHLCPVGWHVATDLEWTLLTNYLGDSIAGAKLREANIAHWKSPNKSATNESGFTALPGGYRSDYDGTFGDIGTYGIWWSATEYSINSCYYRSMGYTSNGVTRYLALKDAGLSVRCVKGM